MPSAAASARATACARSPTGRRACLRARAGWVTDRRPCRGSVAADAQGAYEDGQDSRLHGLDVRRGAGDSPVVRGEVRRHPSSNVVMPNTLAIRRANRTPFGGRHEATMSVIHERLLARTVIREWPHPDHRFTVSSDRFRLPRSKRWRTRRAPQQTTNVRRSSQCRVAIAQAAATTRATTSRTIHSGLANTGLPVRRASGSARWASEACASTNRSER